MSSLKFYSNFDDVPQAIGPYSVACRKDDLLFCSGQIGIDPSTSKLISDDFSEQAQQIFKNIDAILKHFQIRHEHIIKATVFLTDLADFPNFNQLYAKWLGEAKPARSTLGVAALPANAKVEIEITACL